MKKLVLILVFISAFSTVSAEPVYNYFDAVHSNQQNKAEIKETEPAEKVLFILDLSNSMNEKIGSKTKLEIAASVMKDILKILPRHAQTGLRVYGHKHGFIPLKGCSASELISPIAKDNAVNIFAKIDSLKASGWTPITYSLKQALYFDFPQGNYKKRIILISDGGENCGESPCSFAVNVMKHRDDIQIDIIALAVDDQEAANQLRCTALVTSGRFYTANDASGLKDSLKNALNLKKEVSGVILKQ